MTASREEPSASRPPDILRRRVVNWLAGSSAGALAGSIFFPLLRYLSPPRIPEAPTHQIEAGPANDPDLIDKGFKIVRFGSEPVILVRAGDGDFRAFAATCTHLDCIVEYRPERKALWCNCHNGQFDLGGRNVAGPPPRPLARYEVHQVRNRQGATNLVIARS